MRTGTQIFVPGLEARGFPRIARHVRRTLAKQGGFCGFRRRIHQVLIGDVELPTVTSPWIVLQADFDQKWIVIEYVGIYRFRQTITCELNDCIVVQVVIYKL